MVTSAPAINGIQTIMANGIIIFNYFFIRLGCKKLSSSNGYPRYCTFMFEIKIIYFNYLDQGLILIYY